MAKITVIVPVYKVEKYLRKCVDSILTQSFTDFDLILIDDGSPDGCPQICDEYARLDTRVRVVHKTNGGLSDARNAGIDWAMVHSSSEWLVFVDSDDFLHPEYLQVLYQTALNESAELVICDFCRVDDEGVPLEDAHCFRELSTGDKNEVFQYFSQDWHIVSAWNKLYAKSIFSDLRFEFGKIHEDEYAIHHVLWNADKTVIIGKKLYYYRCRQNSIMATESVKSRLDGFEAAIQQYEFSLEHKLPPRYSVVYAEYLNSVEDLKKEVKLEDATRYRNLKQRYRRIYFSNRRNRTPKGYLLYYFNTPYRKAYEMFRLAKGKRHE